MRNGLLDYKSVSAREIAAVLRERKYPIEKKEDPEFLEIFQLLQEAENIVAMEVEE